MQTAVRPPTHQWEANSGRGFWTKRKKTAASLISVMALLAGIAVAFKLFDRTIANNVVRDAAAFNYLIEKNEPAVDGADYHEVPSADAATIFIDGRSQFPGDVRQVNVRLTNTNDPAKDASFQVYLTNLRVTGCAHGDGTPIAINENGQCTSGSNPDPSQISLDDPIYGPTAREYVSFWTVDFERQRAIRQNNPGGSSSDNSTHVDIIYTSSFDDTCSTKPTPDDPNTPNNEAQAGTVGAAPVTDVTKDNPCNLGVIRANGTFAPNAFGADAGEGIPVDTREYRFKLIQRDNGKDQSAYNGWSLSFDLVFGARIPAAPENYPARP